MQEDEVLSLNVEVLEVEGVAHAPVAEVHGVVLAVLRGQQVNAQPDHLREVTADVHQCWNTNKINSGLKKKKDVCFL